jgi:hypothetical protein
MQRLVITLCLGAALAMLAFVAVGMSGARIFPCERGYTADGKVHYGFSSKPVAEWKETECRLGTYRAKYTGAAYGMMAGMFLVGPLLLGLIVGGPMSRKDPNPTKVTQTMASLGLAAGVYALVQVGMRGRGADMEILLAVMGGAVFLSMLSALISRGGQKLALGGVIATAATLALSML